MIFKEAPLEKVMQTKSDNMYSHVGHVGPTTMAAPAPGEEICDESA
jgi:hypothetical protein